MGFFAAGAAGAGAAFGDGAAAGAAAPYNRNACRLSRVACHLLAEQLVVHVNVVVSLSASSNVDGNERRFVSHCSRRGYCSGEGYGRHGQGGYGKTHMRDGEEATDCERRRRCLMKNEQSFDAFVCPIRTSFAVL